MKEIVLRDGRFARIRPITIGDLMVCYSENPVAMTAMLCARATTVDGEQLLIDRMFEDEADIWYPVMLLINQQMKDLMNNMKGIA